MTEIFTRHRFDIRHRTLEVEQVFRLTPQMIRITLTGDELADFISPAPDDHIKLLFEGKDGEVARRTYTPRAYDRNARRLVLDFAVHEAGPATQWAIDARPGTQLQIAGPRGSHEVTAKFDWWLLIGDETALPAMGRWVEEMGPGTRVITLGVVLDAAEEQRFETSADHRALWVHRPAEAAADPAPILQALTALDLPKGAGYVWIAAEAKVARSLRQYFITERNHPRETIRAAGYWIEGVADGSTKTIED